MSESALVSANLTRTPSQTRKYVLIDENRPGTHLRTHFVEPAIGRIAHLICPGTRPGAIAVSSSQTRRLQ